MTDERAILHVDMDAFYASVEQRDDPELAGQPVLVGGKGQRGVVAAASYEAREFGVRSAMPMREALKRCPNAVCVKPRLDHYRDVSQQVFDVFRSITPEVEGLSLDEAFLDVTASMGLFGDPVSIARKIRADIRQATQLTASVGVASNKLVAKIASDLDKPDGLVHVARGDEAKTLAPLSVRALPGIGPRKRAEPASAAIHTIGDLQSADADTLRRLFGRYADRVRNRAHGIDDRPVVAVRDDKSISAERTFSEDLKQRSEMCEALAALADRTATRLRNKRLLAGVIQVKIRQSDFRTFTRQCRVTPATDSTEQLYQSALRLLDEWRAEHPDQPLRLLGVGGSRLVSDQQPDLFAAAEPAADKQVDRTVDAVRERFAELGIAALQSARTLKRDD